MTDPPSMQTVFAGCSRILRESAYYDSTVLQNKGIPIACRIYEALTDNEMGCNSIGNNLAESIQDVGEFLESGPRSERYERDIREYLIRLYLIVEKVYEVLQVIGLREERFRLSTEGMRALRDVKQWANFFKHPGAFLWCHSPRYACDSLGEVDHDGFVIDQEAVNRYYVINERMQRELHAEISNSDNVLVRFPDLENLTERFCQGISDFCTTASAPFFRHVLKRKSTIDDYYDSLYLENFINDGLPPEADELFDPANLQSDSSLRHLESEGYTESDSRSD